jgi:DNA-binding NtrC family response regulator
MAVSTVNDREKNREGQAADGRRHVVILGRDGAEARLLPADGRALIGRDEDADIRIVDPRASRQHARIRMASGGALEIEDLGSANGTWMRDQRLVAGAAQPLQPGDTITIGDTVLIVHEGDPEAEGRRVWTHGYLETRLVEECARGQSRNVPFGLARIHVAGDVPARAVEWTLAGVLRAGDLLAAYAPREYEALLPDTEAASAQALGDAVVAALAAQNVAATCGLALFPGDGTSPQALLGRASERVLPQAPAEAPGTGAGPAVVMESPAMHALYALAARVAAGESPVLILGETGTGKEVLAEAVHRLSPRAARPFLPINCAAFTESLVESELFGFERGAFTGAQQAKTGLIEAASGGTLFLDEIGEMPLSVQAKLLRVIETRQVLRIGATKARAIDVRFVAATNRDLDEEVAEKRFREDLFFRLNVITLEIPPLRERTQEIAALAQMFLRRLAQPAGRAPPALSAEALAALQGYAWPGNIRELRNVIERAFVLCVGGAITLEHLPLDRLLRGSRPAPEPEPAQEAPLPNLRERERAAIVEALARCDGNQTRAAELLGMPRRTFCKRMKEYGIPRPRA